MDCSLELDPHVSHRVGTLGARDLEVVADNIRAIKEDPKMAGHPSGLSQARPGAWQHTCGHSFVVLYRWEGSSFEPAHSGTVRIERLIDRF